MKRLDLGYGNPGFLQEFWTKNHNIHFDANLTPYKLGRACLPELEMLIKSLHEKYKNCVIDNKSQVVVTAGAVQALQAAMYAYRKLYNPSFIHYQVPYWGRFNEFAESQQLRPYPFFKKESKEIAKNLEYFGETTCISLVTTPNNPDGKISTNIPANIQDACYNWPHYTEKITKLKAPVVIFSFSKLSGFSSTRIGWAIVRDDKIASLMRDFVDTYSSGVSTESQLHAAQILELTDERFFKLGGMKLQTRRKILRDLVKKYKLPVEDLSERGMFWYIKADRQFIFDLHVKCIDGRNSGDPGKNRWRLNIGCHTEDFKELVDRIAAVGKKYKS